MSMMKKLQMLFLAPALALLMVACGDSTPTTPVVNVSLTASLNLTVNGIPTAPVKVFNAAGEVKFDGTVTGSKSISALPRDKYTITGGAVANFAAPATQTADLGAGDGSATLTYLALAGQAVVPDRIQGTLSDPLARGNKVGIFLSNGILSSTVIGSDGSMVLPLAIPPVTEMVPFLAGGGPGCTYTGAGGTNSSQVYFATELDVYNVQGDFFGTVKETVFGQDATTLLEHIYSQNAQSFKATLSCATSTSAFAYQIDVQLAAGWNVILQRTTAGGNAILSTAPADTRVGLVFKKLSAAVNIVLDTPSLNLKAGESTTVNATIYQNGGISGKIDLSTDVQGVTVEPASVTLPALGTQSVTAQSIFGRLVSTAQGVRALKVGSQSLRTPLTIKVAADAGGFNGTMNIIASQSGKPVGQTSVSLNLLAPGVRVSIINSYNGLVLAVGETIAVRVQADSSNGYDGPVNISISDLPPGITSSNKTIQVTPNISTSVDIDLTANNISVEGLYRVQIKSTPNNLEALGGSSHLYVIPRRTIIATPIQKIYPAKQGVWVVGNREYGEGGYYREINRYLDGTKQNSTSGYNIDLPLRATPSGDLLNTFNTSGILRYIHDNGLFDDISVGGGAVNVGEDEFGYNAESISTILTNGDIWFVKYVNNNQKLLQKYSRRTGIISTIGDITDYSGYGIMRMNNSGSKIILFDSRDNRIRQIDTSMGGIVNLVTRPPNIGSLAVAINGTIWTTPYFGTLQHTNDDGTITTFNDVAGSNIIGFDWIDENILWLRSNDEIIKYNVMNNTIKRVKFGSTNIGQVVRSLTGGVDIYLLDINNLGNKYYLSHW